MIQFIIIGSKLYQVKSKVEFNFLKVLSYILALITVLPVVFLIAYIAYYIFSYYSNKNMFLTIIMCVTVVLLLAGFVGYLLMFICDFKIRRMRFSNFREEELYRQHITQEKTRILFTIKENSSNCFVMMHFQKNNNVIPVVYTKYDDKISVCNLNVKYLYSEIEKDNEIIKLCVVINQSTKTVIIVAVSKNNNSFIISGDRMDKVHSSDDTLNYNVYATFLPFEKCENISEIIIDDLSYQLTNSKISKIFVTMNE